MKIRFKVVNENRNSYLVPETSPYSLYYKKDRITTAKKGTIGIMVFDTIESAEEYTIALLFNYKIIEVDARGRMKKIDKVSCAADTVGLDIFYGKAAINILSQMKPFPGTECYPRVKVLT